MKYSCRTLRRVHKSDSTFWMIERNSFPLWLISMTLRNCISKGRNSAKVLEFPMSKLLLGPDQQRTLVRWLGTIRERRAAWWMGTRALDE